MKTITAKLNIDQKKFKAAQLFMKEKGLDINTELSKVAEDFYKKHVLADVRKSIERTVPATCCPAAKTSISTPPKPLESGSKEPDSRENSGVLYHTRSASNKIP